MSIQLSDHFDYQKLLKLTLPSIIMLVVTSLYSFVDGFFVSNYAGKTSFAAVNFIMPFLMVLGSIGFMLGTRGGALIAKKMGGKQRRKSKSDLFHDNLFIRHDRGRVGDSRNCFFKTDCFSFGGGG